jgi:hypothetical protein
MTPYLQLDDLFKLIPPSLEELWTDYASAMEAACGSSHNHQAWPGGYKHHVVECLNIVLRQYRWMDEVRPLPFSLEDALVVMFLHDIEKPFKNGGFFKVCRCKALCGHLQWGASKAFRKKFRTDLIHEIGIKLSEAQWNALQYVEGVPDNEYSPGERTMGELAAFCHCADILSARLWHDKGETGGW